MKSKKQKKSSQKINLGPLLVVIGLVLIGLFPVYRNMIDSKLGPATENSVASENDHGPIQAEESLLQEAALQKPLPVRVIIPENNIDVSLRPARVLNGRWEVFEDSGSYGLGSAFPGDTGNMVLFAHARPGYFLELRSTEVGNKVYVFTESAWFEYRVFETREVSPNDISVIMPTEDEVLTLYTCSGFADSKRMIVAARRVK